MDHWEFDRADVTLVHSPLCHSAPLRFSIGTLQAGGSVALAGKFAPDRISAALTELRPTTAFVVPSQLQQLLDFGMPPSPYRLLAHAGSSCPPAVKSRVHEWAGAEHTWEFYGATEGQFTSCRGTEWQERPGTVGRARAGRSLSIDEVGRVWCVPPDFTRFEYWRDPTKTAAAWRNTELGPAFTVGDLGRLDDEGYLYFDGRREDLIISGGVNVYPAEVEAALSGMPSVTDVAVYAVPDDRWGQRVVAAVVGDASEAELEEWCRDRLAAYKRPKQWHLLDALPRNSMGKIQRRSLPT
jgi:long-chain acyl-CoA synthetase